MRHLFGPVKRLWLMLFAVTLCCGVLLPPTPALADVIAPGEKGISYCFEVANLAAYPDYVVLLVTVNPSLGPYGVLQPGGCASFYKHSTGLLYAVREAAFDPASVPADASSQAAYFAAQPQFLSAPLRLRPLTTVNERDSRTSITDIVEIGALTDQGFAARFARVRYTYPDGTAEELAVAADGVRPAPRVVAESRAALVRSFAWAALVPALALLGLGTLFALRRRRR
jgi:hypothetical protein